MNNAVNQIAITDVSVSASKQHKAKDTESGEFGEMLSGAMQTTEQPANADADAAETQTQTQATETQSPEQELTGEEGEQEYAQQLAAVMMTQTIIPTIAGTPQTETATQEVTADITEAEVPQTVQTAVQEAVTPQTTEVTEMPEQNVLNQAVQKDTASRITRETASAEAQATAVQEEQPNPQVMEKAADTTIQRQPKNETTTVSKDAPEIGTDMAGTTSQTGEQAIDQTNRAVVMHNMRHPQQTDETQNKFDNMLAKAAQQLNPTADEAETEMETEVGIEPETEPETTDDTTLEQEQPFILEGETQDSDGQAETPERRPDADIKPQEESKTTIQVDTQKPVKAPVTEQRQQQEISKPDEVLLSMAQTKQPEAVHETVRSEPAQQPQPQQPQATEQADQIKAQVVKNLETQRTEFQMQLHPEELGKVNVKMILEGGKLTVEIIAANPRSAELLSRQADALAMSLKAGNIETTTVNVVTAPENASSQMNGQFDLNNFQNRFGNQGHTNKQNGTNPANDSDEQGGVGGQIKPDNPQAPNRLLNYSV